MERRYFADFDFKKGIEEAKNQAPKPLPPLINGTEIQSRKLPLPEEVIAGLLSQGEKGELAGGSKSFKTWALIHQALAIASGCGWWGFPTPVSNVIFLNLEIPPPFFEARVRAVAETLCLDIPENFYVWHLRRCKLGDPERWRSFLDELKERTQAIPRPYLTSDPIYKLLGGRNENAAGDVQLLLEQLDDMVECVEGSNFFGHHFSKGNQAGKDAVDRASGSGVFARDPDSILTMTKHEKEGAFTIDAIIRNHPPIDQFVVEWKYPVFERNQILDPEELKEPKAKKNKKYDPHMLVFWLGANELSTAEWAQTVCQETGMSRTTFFELKAQAELNGLIQRNPHNPKLWLKK
jgi:hypothetical protein